MQAKKNKKKCFFIKKKSFKVKITYKINQILPQIEELTPHKDHSFHSLVLKKWGIYIISQ